MLQTVCASWRHFFALAATRPDGTKVLQWNDAFVAACQSPNGPTIATLQLVIESSGHVDAIKWLATAPGVTAVRAPETPRLSESETLALVTWLHTTEHGQWSVNTMDSAAANGYLSVVQWLDENRSEGCSTLAMDRAAANGHLRVVQWLHTNRTEGCTPTAMLAAASNGHSNVVAWLYGSRSEGNGSLAMTYAAANGHLDMVEWCLEHNGCAKCVRDQLLARCIVFRARGRSGPNTHVLYVLQWLDVHKNRTAVACTGNCASLGGRDRAVSLAATAVASGNMLLLAYLDQHHRDLFAWREEQKKSVIDAITWGGHLGAIQWLYDRHPTSLNGQRLLESAERRRQNRIVQWLHSVLVST